jgi:tripartite-type tricarboxylate transporter receptor subunit TctC
MPKLVLNRRWFLPLAAAIGAVGYDFPVISAHADTYPSQPITFIIPDGLGGTTSTLVREFSVRLGNYFNPSVDVEPFNDPGAGGQKAALDIFRAAPDGYTIGMLGSVTHINGTNVLNKLSWIANLNSTRFALAVNTKSKINNVADLKRLSQERPVKFSSSSKTAISYFATALFCKLNNIPCNIVTGYKGASDSMLAVARGEVDATCQNLPTLALMEKTGLLRPIFAFTEKSPFPGVEDATSINEPELTQVVSLNCVAGPPGLPKQIVDKLATAFKRISNDSSTQIWAEKLNIPIDYLGPVDTKKAVESQVALAQKWQGQL